jgi:predicted nucleic acid-binding protein
MWVVPEPLSPQAEAVREDFRNQVHELLAPDLFLTEIANALIVAERRGRLLPGRSTILFADVATTMPAIHITYPNVLTRAHAIAASTVASVYDALYVALAEQQGCELITADDKLVNNLQAQFPFIRHLSSLP